MKSVEHYRYHTLREAERIISDPQPEASFLDLWRAATDKSLQDKERIRLALNFFHDKVPGLDQVYRKVVHNQKQLPFNPETLSFEGKINEGAPTVVYLLESQDPVIPSWVLKVRQWRSKNLEKTHEHARKEKEEYERIREWYHELPDLIPTEYFLIMQSPRRGDGPSVIAVQQFLGSELRDLFTLSKDEIERLYAENPRLKDDLKEFATITLGRAYQYSEAIDIHGKKNVIIGNVNGKPELRFIDPHWIFMLEESEQNMPPHVRETITQRLRYLRELTS